MGGLGGGCYVSGCVHNSAFKDEFLCILDLPSRTRGKDIFKTIDTFFKANDIKWELLCGLCTDGAPAMLGHSSGFYAHVKKVSPLCTFMHCMIHGEALASKTLGPDLTAVLRQVIKLVNTVKSSALNARLFRRFCEQMDADHCNLLYHRGTMVVKRQRAQAGLYSAERIKGLFLCSKRKTS